MKFGAGVLLSILASKPRQYDPWLFVQAFVQYITVYIRADVLQLSASDADPSLLLRLWMARTHPANLCLKSYRLDLLAMFCSPVTLAGVRTGAAITHIKAIGTNKSLYHSPPLGNQLSTNDIFIRHVISKKKVVKRP